MTSETEFVDGLIAKAPNPKAPEYVKARLSIKREELIAWLQSQRGEWINADIKESKGGKWYVAVDAWKPEGQDKRGNTSSGRGQRAPKPGNDYLTEDGEIPFATNRSTF